MGEYRIRGRHHSGINGRRGISQYHDSSECRETIAFFTDGYLEADDASGNPFIPAIFSKLPAGSPNAATVGKAIEKGFKAFMGKAGPADDVTLLVINSR